MAPSTRLAPSVQTDQAATVDAVGAAERWKTIFKRGLQLGFLFFLLKGIAWLVVGWLAWQGLS